MVSINWCRGVKGGLEIVEPNENMFRSYLEMAEESFQMIKNNAESKIWTASTSYYTMYYSLYAVMIKVGIKCEIHSCSIEFMKKYLGDLYGGEFVELIKEAFEVRKDLQYYPDKLIDESKLLKVKQGAVDFFVKTKEIVERIGESVVKEIRQNFEVGNER